MIGKIAAGPKRVKPSAIDRELEGLWISMPPTGSSSSTPMAMRAVVANLIAVRDSKQAADEALSVIGNIIGNHPCRVIMISSEPDLVPPELTADVAVLCRQSETCRRCVYCDLIHLAGRGIMADNLPSMAAALLTPDLPVVLWYPNPPFERNDVIAFAGQSNRVIVDSADYARDDMRRLARFVEKSHHLGTAVSDLNWARLTIYRQSFAQFFDSLECRDHLAAIHSIRIEAAPSTGLLLAGWLKAQMDKNGYPVPRERITLAQPGPDGSLFKSLAMTCAGGNHSFTVTRQDAVTLEARSIVDANTSTRVLKAGLPSEAKLLGDELMFAGHDTIFETALAAAVTL